MRLGQSIEFGLKICYNIKKRIVNKVLYKTKTK